MSNSRARRFPECLAHSVTRFSAGYNLDLLCFTVFLVDDIHHQQNGCSSLFHINSFPHELLNFHLKRWGMQIITNTLEASGQKRRVLMKSSLHVKTQHGSKIFSWTHPHLPLLIWYLNEASVTHFWWNIHLIIWEKERQYHSGSFIIPVNIFACWN